MTEPNERSAWADVVAELRQENATLRNQLEGNDDRGGAVALTVVLAFIVGVIVGGAGVVLVQRVMQWIG